MATVASRRNAVTKLFGLAFSKAGPATVDGSGAAVPPFQRALGGFRSMMTTSARNGAVRRGLEDGKLAGSRVFMNTKQQPSQAGARQGSRLTTRSFASSGGGHGEEVVHVA